MYSSITCLPDLPEVLQHLRLPFTGFLDIEGEDTEPYGLVVRGQVRTERRNSGEIV